MTNRIDNFVDRARPGASPPKRQRRFPPSQMCTLAGVLMAVLACSADTSEPESMVDGRVLESANGALSGTFEMTAPHKGLNSLVVHVLEGEDKPLAAAEVTISPWMPAHGHGSIDTVAEEVPAEGEGGEYVADDVYFSMTGYWELHVDVLVGGEIKDSFLVPVHVR